MRHPESAERAERGAPEMWRAVFRGRYRGQPDIGRWSAWRLHSPVLTRYGRGRSPAVTKAYKRRITKRLLQWAIWSCAVAYGQPRLLPSSWKVRGENQMKRPDVQACIKLGPGRYSFGDSMSLVVRGGSALFEYQYREDKETKTLVLGSRSVKKLIRYSWLCD
jgi:hypothetical protein